ncbi:hypothetical protein MUK42_16877 [Musa troglodytarum]|uniref:Uncharacterized protein n=1 Tax=Musa troglodytarum TaxID=320322 RepID=A0A9E7HWR8_9LILI|nr:hypothetical protein MUK42_16877 [Musa troglodytarum]
MSSEPMMMIGHHTPQGRAHRSRGAIREPSANGKRHQPPFCGTTPRFSSTLPTLLQLAMISGLKSFVAIPFLVFYRAMSLHMQQP